MPIVVRVKAVSHDRQNREVHVMTILTNHPDAALQVAQHIIDKRVHEARTRARRRLLSTIRHHARHAQPTP